MKRQHLAVLILLLTPSKVLLAEGGCPSGMYPYDTPQARQCVPIPGGSSSSSAPAAVYENRWGAIATDGPKGILGSSKNQTSKRKAEKQAVSECQEKGGTCKLQMSYRNQCAVLVSGDKKFLVQRAESIEVATEIAIRECGAVDANCRVHYSDCSYPEQVR